MARKYLFIDYSLQLFHKTMKNCKKEDVERDKVTLSNGKIDRTIERLLIQGMANFLCLTSNQFEVELSPLTLFLVH